MGERRTDTRMPKMVELHCSCRMPEEGDQMAMWDTCHVFPSEVFADSEVHWECKMCTS